MAKITRIIPQKTVRASRKGSGLVITHFFVVDVGGLARASRVVVTPLGLGTASRFRLVTEHRSGVLAHTHAKQLACSTSIKKSLHNARDFFGGCWWARTTDLCRVRTAL